MTVPVQKPSVARMVHYRSYGTPGGEFEPACRAAIVTEVDPVAPWRVGLAVLNPAGIFLHSLSAGGSVYHGGDEQAGSPDCSMQEAHGNPFRYCQCGWIEASYHGGTWHWPERV